MGAKILDVVYNATNNEMVRTKTIVKNCIVKVDASAFKAWYQEKYGIGIAAGKDFPELAEMTENVSTKKVKTEEEIKAEKAVKIAKKKEAAKGGVTKKKDDKAKPMLVLVHVLASAVELMVTCLRQRAGFLQEEDGQKEAEIKIPEVSEIESLFHPSFLFVKMPCLSMFVVIS